MLDLRTLELFVAVAERLSVSKAADVMHISQSALSRQIQALEERLGLQLFDRVGKRLRLTAEGEDLLPRVAALLDQARNLSSRARSMALGNRGLLRVGATPQTIEAVLSPVLVGMRQKYPEVDVTLLEGPNDYLLEQVRLGGVHVAIASVEDTQHEFAHHDLFLGHLFAIASMAHPLPDGGYVDIRSLAGVPLLLLRKGFMTRSLFDQACRQAGIRVHSILESDSTQTLCALARAGHGVAVLSSTAISHMREGRVVGLTLDGRRLSRMISAVWDPRRYTSNLMSPFLDELHASLASKPLNDPAA